MRLYRIAPDSRQDVAWGDSDAPELPMTVCPVALAVGCKSCPIFRACPLKGVVGDYRPGKATKAPAARRKGPRTRR